MIDITSRVMYFCDFPYDGDFQRDFEYHIEDPSKSEGIKFSNYIITNIPEYQDSNDFDILFFDWGGMSMGNSMMESFIRDIMNKAQECPSKYFVMSSEFTSYAAEEILAEIPKEDAPKNLFVFLKDFIEFIKKTNYAGLEYKEVQDDLSSD